MNISQRIKTISKYVPDNAVVADIGTDHGYLLYHLLETGRISFGFGCDVNKNPLSFAKKNLEKHIKNNKACLCLGDGLAPLLGQKVDCIAIAGMGGLLMVTILQAQMEVAQSAGRLVLSPNLAADKLRFFVTTHGWSIVQEDLVFEDGKFYPIIVLEKGSSKTLSECEAFFGPILIREQHPLVKDFFIHEKQKVDTIVKKIEESGHPHAKEMILAEEKKWNEKSRCIHGN